MKNNRKQTLFKHIIIFGSFLFLLSCTINKDTGAITVINKTTLNEKELKVGDVYIGYVAAGQTRTVYFYSDEKNAKISAENFKEKYGINPEAPYDYDDHYKGTIDLKLNYSYKLYLKYRIEEEDDEDERKRIYYLDITGEKYGIDEEDRGEDNTVERE